VQKYERDLKRWEFMENEADREHEKIEMQKQKYLVGNSNKGGAAYNILSLEYDPSKEGEHLR
jgi:hypothetical protein